VVLHEYGHALTARRYGIQVRDIILLPIGGIANLTRNPDKPWHEFVITLAGPLVNVAIALLLFPVVLVLSNGSVQQFLRIYIQSAMREPGPANLLVYLFITNILLALFNLIPAFPMDGGRILRSLLAMRMPMARATQTAVFVGRIMAVLLALWGIFGGGISLLLIAFFVYVGGSAELEAVTSRAVLRGIKARTAITPNAVRLYNSETIGRAADLIMTSYQVDYPIMDLSGRFAGVLTRPRLIAALRDLGPDARIADVMISAAEMPVLGPDAELTEVWERMATTGSRVVVIEENRQFLGLITAEDISEVFQVIGAVHEGRERRGLPASPMTTLDVRDPEATMLEKKPADEEISGATKPDMTPAGPALTAGPPSPGAPLEAPSGDSAPGVAGVAPGAVRKADPFAVKASAEDVSTLFGPGSISDVPLASPPLLDAAEAGAGEKESDPDMALSAGKAPPHG
jgi:Zn-dependent protease/predicted transcriptional regulator